MDVLSGSLFSLSGRVSILETSVPTEVVTPSDDTSILSAFIRTLEKLFVQIETVFDEIVTFVKSVTFQSDVTFEERVIFEDRDMAGTAIILAGANSVRVDFDRPYASIPVVTVSADAFVTYRVTDKGVTGFTIETQDKASSDTRFDWIALMVTGSSVTSSISSSGKLVPEESTTTESFPEEVAPEVVPETPVEEVLPTLTEEISEEVSSTTTPEEVPEVEVTAEEITEKATSEQPPVESVSDTTSVELATSEVPTETPVIEDAPTESTPEVPAEVFPEVSTVSGE